MQAVEEQLEVQCARAECAPIPHKSPTIEDPVCDVARGGRLVETARALLLRAVRGDATASRALRAREEPLAARAATGDPYACEILAAMCAGGLGSARNPERAREWMVRAVELLEEHVRRPIPGMHGFMLLPSDAPERAYRPLYTAAGVLVTDEIGTARTQGGAIVFDRWGRPKLREYSVAGDGPTRATPKAVAARIARESTLEDFSWACRRTTRDFRSALIDARVIAHGRMSFQRCKAPGLAT